MHIPDAYLSPGTQAAAFAVMVPVWVLAAKKTRQQLSARQVPLLSIGAAFAFAVQMFNIPAVGGTTAHALGTALLAILLGPWAAIVAMTLCLAIQAFFFGDGGILSLGANCFDMALISAIVSYGSYKFMSRSANSEPKRLVSAALAAYLGTVVASFSAGLILGAQPLVAHDNAGHALYFPFGWSVSIPAMVNVHLLIAAPAEAIVTCLALGYLWKNFPDLVREHARVRVRTPLRLGKVLFFVLLLTPIGLIASGDAWGEWDASTLQKMIGYVPSGAARSKELIAPVLKDYGLVGHGGAAWQIGGYLLSAFLGALLIAATIRALMKKSRSEPVPEAKSNAPQLELPNWMKSANPVATRQPSAGKPWLEMTLLKLRDTVAKTLIAQDWAALPGMLQRVPAIPKILATLTALVFLALSHSASILGGTLFVLAAIAWGARLPLGPVLTRVTGSAAFFGLILALPLTLQSVSPGPALVRVGPIAFSETGIAMGSLLLLRLACGIFVALLLTSTTRWNEIARALQALRLPRVFVTGFMLTYRYIFVLTDTMAEMVVARKSRQPGCIGKAEARQYAGAATAVLFSKSMAFSEESYMAMRSRLFEAQRPTKAARRKGFTDWVWATGGSVALVAVLLNVVIHAL